MFGIEIAISEVQCNDLVAHLDRQLREGVPLSRIDLKPHIRRAWIGVDSVHVGLGRIDLPRDRAIDPLLRDNDSTQQPELLTEG